MANNKGKAWEQKFKEDWKKTFPDGTIDRLYDPTNGFVAISNISDFIGYRFPLIYYLECKSKEGNTFPFSNLSQYDKLVLKVGIKGVRVGVVIWFISHDKVIYAPISTITKMLNDGKKSINITKDLNEYNLIEVPGFKKRKDGYMNCDYTLLKDLKEGE